MFIKDLFLKVWNIKIVQQFVKFGLVGVINTLITLGAIYVLRNVFDVAKYPSNFIGYLLGFCNSFILNRIWTFQSKGSVKKDTTLFIIVSVATYILQVGILAFLSHTLKINEGWATIIANIFYTVIGFAGNKFITFRN